MLSPSPEGCGSLPAAGRDSPVVIGGVGGSGTRVVAEIVASLGWHLGADLNHALDHLGFTLLFKHARWRTEQSAGRNRRALELLARSLRGRPRLRPGFLALAARAAAGMVRGGHNHLGEGSGFWPLVRAGKLFVDGPSRRAANQRCWGWKEPNSHIFLDQIAAAFPGVRYIHTIRHGVDMAFSENLQQLMTWGSFFDVAPPSSADETPRALLTYWVRANRRAFAIGSALGSERFLSLRFEDLCRTPEAAVVRIAAFLGRDLEPGERARLAAIPNAPDSIGRHRHHDLGQFRREDLDAVSELGFELEGGRSGGA